MCDRKLDQVEKYIAICALVSILLGAIIAVANVAIAETSDSPDSPTVDQDAPEGPPSALDAFESGGFPWKKFACSEKSGRVCSVLFVGDSFTHGRYTPVRTFNAEIPGEPWQPPQVIDENYGETGEREELEPGPWGGIPGIFSELAQQMHLSYEVHIEAISATSRILFSILPCRSFGTVSMRSTT
jgi:hypothetical protein